MGSLFDDLESQDRKRLEALGWTPIAYAGLVGWKAPDGSVYTTTEGALRELERREGKVVGRG